jgi:hypothetical protein
LPTLLRIALVFGVGLEFFFAGAREKAARRGNQKSERVDVCQSAPGARDAAYRLTSLDDAATERRFNWASGSCQIIRAITRGYSGKYRSITGNANRDRIEEAGSRSSRNSKEASSSRSGVEPGA